MPNDPLFPELPEDVKALSDAELESLQAEFDKAMALCNDEGEEGQAYLGDLDASEVIAQMTAGAESILTLRNEVAARAEAHEAFNAKKAEINSMLEVKGEAPAEEEAPAESEEEASEEEAPAEDAEAEEETAEEEAEEAEAKAEERELVTADGEEKPSGAEVVRMRRLPTPSRERVVVKSEDPGVALLAAGDMAHRFRDPLDPHSLAELVIASAMHHGPHPKVDPSGKYRFGGPEHKIAHADFPFPDDRVLTDNIDENVAKIREVIVAGLPGGFGGYSLTASGGLCAPLTPIYSMPQFATDAEPVWDSLPKFQAARGGVNTPEATIIGDITTAISSISEANDALGGTFATKSCQDMTCPSYTEVAVQILAHCREYGNLNARAWPEKIRHENELTMAALAQTSENFMLERIKALSINVTSGAATLSAMSYFVDAVVKNIFGVRGRLRMARGARFRALLPIVLLDMLLLDTVQTVDGNRFRTREQISEYLSSVGIDVVWYLDGNFTAGDDMVPDAAQAAGALESWPNTFQWAFYPEGAFLGIDMGSLELGIVRDSTLNSTNDFQVFGEKFRNVARIAPAQATYWNTTTLCAIGQFPPTGTARTCES
jgi:antitoxin (DNA-binding transcriptional repressor) of toxin-antitoxin stability system